jgi:hypothetical protein
MSFNNAFPFLALSMPKYFVRFLPDNLYFPTMQPALNSAKKPTARPPITLAVWYTKTMC